MQQCSKQSRIKFESTTLIDAKLRKNKLTKVTQDKKKDKTHNKFPHKTDLSLPFLKNTFKSNTIQENVEFTTK